MNPSTHLKLVQGQSDYKSADVEVQSDDDHENTSGGGGPPMNLEARVDKLEQDVSAIRESVGRIDERSKTFVSRADLTDTKVTLISWQVGIAVAIISLLIAILALE